MRFFLVDPSIKSLTGHHTTYAASVLKAASDSAMECVVATHREIDCPSLDTLESSPCRVVPVFRHEHWRRTSEFPLLHFGITIAAHLLTFLRAARTRLLGLFRSLSAYTSVTPPDTNDAPPGALEEPAGGAPALSIRTALTRLCTALVHEWMRFVKPVHFSRDLEQLHRSSPFGDRDHVFMPTLSVDEVNGLTRWLTHHPDCGTTWHLLFRYDLHAPSSGARAARRHVKAFRQAFLRLNAAAATSRVYCWTDTDELTEQYRRLGVMSFETLPIPHTYGHPSPRERADSPRVATYLGDARCEKGFHLLPSLIARCRSLGQLNSRLRFRIHINVGAQSEPAVAYAAATLTRDPDIDTVSGPLTQSGYNTLLATSDVVLLLYSSAIYRARSSGVLAEAISAGIPVVVFRNTWLAGQVLPYCVRHWETLLLTAEPRRSLIAIDDPRLHAVAAREGRPADAAFTFEEADAALVFEGEKLAADAPAAALTLNWQACDGRHIHHETIEPAGQTLSGGVLHMVMIPPDAAAVTVRCSSGTHAVEEKYGTIRWSACGWADRSRGHVPAGAVGVICSNVEEASLGLADIVTHYEHYRRTAWEMGADYLRRNNPAALLASILSRSHVPSSSA